MTTQIYINSTHSLNLRKKETFCDTILTMRENPQDSNKVVMGKNYIFS